MCCGGPKKQLLETSGAPYPLERVLPYWKKRSLETWEVKDLEMRTLSWIIWGGALSVVPCILIRGTERR